MKKRLQSFEAKAEHTGGEKRTPVFVWLTAMYHKAVVVVEGRQ